jgi:hypothetical protein
MKKEYNLEDSGQNLKSLTTSKFEHDLYYDEKNIEHKIIRVKRFSLPNNGEKWKIIENNKVLMTIEGVKLTTKEKEYLRTVEGFNFLIKEYKLGIKSFNALKQTFKAQLMQPTQSTQSK